MKYTGRKMEQRWTGCSEELCSSIRSQPILPRVTEGGRPGPVDACLGSKLPCRPRQKDHKSKGSLGNLVRACSKRMKSARGSMCEGPGSSLVLPKNCVNVKAK